MCANPAANCDETPCNLVEVVRYMPSYRKKEDSLKPKSHIYIQVVPGGKDLTSGECSLSQTIPI